MSNSPRTLTLIEGTIDGFKIQRAEMQRENPNDPAIKFLDEIIEGFEVIAARIHREDMEKVA